MKKSAAKGKKSVPATVKGKTSKTNGKTNGKTSKTTAPKNKAKPDAKPVMGKSAKVIPLKARTAMPARPVAAIAKVKPQKPMVKSAPASAQVTTARPEGTKTMMQKTVQKPMVSQKASLTQPVLKPVPAGAERGEKLEFKKDDYVVYPAHGVGRVEGVETHAIAGMEITLYTIFFEQERMRLKVPVNKAKTAGLRKLSSRNRIQDAMSTLTGKARIRRVMWSRRAQEYEAKINSGDPVMIAEVVRDLHRATDQPEQSYSERQIYQAALERLARELAAVEKIDTDRAAEKLEAIMTRRDKADKGADKGAELAKAA